MKRISTDRPRAVCQARSRFRCAARTAWTSCSQRDRRCLHPVLLATLAALLAPLAGAQAQPFLHQPVGIAASFAAERMALRLGALELAVGSGTSSASQRADVVQSELEQDWPLFQASLVAARPALATALPEALRTAGQAPDSGAAVAVKHAATLAQQVAASVETATLGVDAEARSALAAMLLTGTGGLSDRYGDAADSGSSLDAATAWATLRRIHQLWTTLAPHASASQHAEAQDMLARLDAILPSASPPKAADKGTANDVEDATNRLVNVLQSALGTSLQPDRNLASLASTVDILATRGCAGDDVAARQDLAVTAMYYGDYLSNTVSMLTPDDDHAVRTAFEMLASASSRTSDTCRGLLNALGRVTATLGG